jgi:hypothetical protein
MIPSDESSFRSDLNEVQSIVRRRFPGSPFLDHDRSGCQELKRTVVCENEKHNEH